MNGVLHGSRRARLREIAEEEAVVLAQVASALEAVAERESLEGDDLELKQVLSTLSSLSARESGCLDLSQKLVEALVEIDRRLTGGRPWATALIPCVCRLRLFGERVCWEEELQRRLAATSPIVRSGRRMLQASLGGVFDRAGARMLGDRLVEHSRRLRARKVVLLVPRGHRPPWWAAFESALRVELAAIKTRLELFDGEA